MKPTFWKLYFRMFYKPKSTFQIVFENNISIKLGLFSLLIPALGYTIFYIMAYFAGGSPSTFKPWLALPIEKYFKYDIFLTLPGYYLSWIGASVTVYLFTKINNHNSKFDEILAVIGIGVGVATWSSLFHDLIDAFLSVIGVIDMREYEQLLNQPTFWKGLLLTLYALYFFWFLILFTLGIKVSQKCSLIKSLAIAFVGLISFQVILLIFIR